MGRRGGGRFWLRTSVPSFPCPPEKTTGSTTFATTPWTPKGSSTASTALSTVMPSAMQSSASTTASGCGRGQRQVGEHEHGHGHQHEHEHQHQHQLMGRGVLTTSGISPPINGRKLNTVVQIAKSQHAGTLTAASTNPTSTPTVGRQQR